MAVIYVLDTNVVSELMRDRPDAGVVDRLTQLDDSAWYLSAVTEAELRHGLALMPAGRRRSRLMAALQVLLAQEFAGRVLPFDAPAAVYYADAMAARGKAGRPLQVQDAMIAACCRVHGATLLTRNVRDFEGLDVPLVDPWAHPPVAE